MSPRLPDVLRPFPARTEALLGFSLDASAKRVHLRAIHRHRLQDIVLDTFSTMTAADSPVSRCIPTYVNVIRIYAQ
ncbi:hypothetical protein BD626DRAFT_508880 [Schizophyllum amplum]|uniref:Uncharacterized protein n=1 Tax=Schizophyllum amplum TaxID=97359 RepID=A0A550C3C9_9AGAR|nr:hypothetical protein BD626DRAFT_510714 [Auriculariopsis ampla]TRM59312.1 hypothetical protein BD626DRAFT_508880 [Auriculariopsis ampla]